MTSSNDRTQRNHLEARLPTRDLDVCGVLRGPTRRGHSSKKVGSGVRAHSREYPVTADDSMTASGRLTRLHGP